MEIEGPRRNSSFPYKETLDYAKNLAFSAGVCAFSLTTTKGVGEARESPFWLCFSFVTGALMGLLTVCATRAYSQSFPAASKTVRTVAEVFAFVFWSATVYFVKWKIDQ